MRLRGEHVEHGLDSLSLEAPLQININGEAFTVSMRTPGHDEELVRGILYAENIAKDADQPVVVEVLKHDEQGLISIVNVKIPEEKLGKGYLNSRSLLSVSSCGICGKTELGALELSGEQLEQQEGISIPMLSQLFEKMRSAQFGFDQSGGCHAAAVFTLDGKLLSAREDIGRHNAVDKVVGRLIMDGSLKEARILTVSGRVSYEIIAKCFRARIPVLAAVSAPSSLAVDFAKELGITLFAFTRDNRTTCYAHPERIANLNKIIAKAS